MTDKLGGRLYVPRISRTKLVIGLKKEEGNDHALLHKRALIYLASVHFDEKRVL